MHKRGRPGAKLTRAVNKSEIEEKIVETRRVNNLRYLERLQAIRYLNEGKNRFEIADLLQRCQESILHWMKLWNEEGYDGLKPVFEPKRKGRLSMEQIEALKSDIRKNPRDLGYEKDYWSAKLIFNHIESTFGISYHRHSWTRCLRLWKIKARVPRVLSSQQDPKKVEEFWLGTVPNTLGKKLL